MNTKVRIFCLKGALFAGTFVVAFFAMASDAAAQCAYWDKSTNAIHEYAGGKKIGMADSATNRAELNDGKAASSAGFDCVVDSSTLQTFDPDDLSTPIEAGSGGGRRAGGRADEGSQVRQARGGQTRTGTSRASSGALSIRSGYGAGGRTVNSLFKDGSVEDPRDIDDRSLPCVDGSCAPGACTNPVGCGDGMPPGACFQTDGCGFVGTGGPCQNPNGCGELVYGACMDPQGCYGLPYGACLDPDGCRVADEDDETDDDQDDGDIGFDWLLQGICLLLGGCGFEDPDTGTVVTVDFGVCFAPGGCGPSGDPGVPQFPGGGGSGGPGGQQIVTAVSITSDNVGINAGPDDTEATEGGTATSAGAVSWLDQVKDGGGMREIKALKLDNVTSKLETGYQRAPTILDPRDIKEAYPDLIADGSAATSTGTSTGEDPKRPSLAAAYGYDDWETIPEASEIGVDAEILKTSMSIYQPLSRLKKDALESTIERDRGLDAAVTLRGVSEMALSFLDKTLGSALNTTQAKADRHVMMELQKQANWSLARLAHPDQQQIYVDTDEKLEACLGMAFESGFPADTIEGPVRTRVKLEEECSAECGEPPENRQYRTDDYAELGNGTYSYCVCCAETANELNCLGEGCAREGEVLKGDTRFWSLWERAFWGVSKDQSSATGVAEIVNDTLRSAIMLYGDKVLKKSDSSAEPYFYYTTQMPKVSMRRFIALHKNRCHHTDKGAVAADLAEVGDCGIDDLERFKIKYGVCPSFMNLVENWQTVINGGTRPPDWGIWWAEASMGHPMAGHMIKEFLSLNGDPAATLAKKAERHKLATVIENWCEASAVAGAVRQHANLASIVIRHIQLSEQLSQYEKNLLYGLVERYSRDLQLASMDNSSKLAAQAALTGVSIAFDRRTAAYMGSVNQTAQAALRMAGSEGGQLAFNSSGFIDGNGLGSADPTATSLLPTANARSSKNIDFGVTLTPKEQRLVRQSERLAVKDSNNRGLGSLGRLLGR